MALDKAVDSAALDAGMSLVADAIRTKSGTTEPLVWPDGYADAVEAIQVGGGIVLPDGVAITQGQFTMAEDTSELSIEHGLGTIPNIGVLWTEDAQLINQISYTLCARAFKEGNVLKNSAGVYFSSSSADVGTFYLTTANSINESYPPRSAMTFMDETYMYIYKGTTVKYLTAGTTYKWMAIYIPTQEGLRG